jgi:hypothetical protein
MSDYGLDVDQLRVNIVRPVLIRLDLHTPAAENLVLGTALHESHARYLRQIKGPAMGIYQMEPATHFDLHRNFLRHNTTLKVRINNFASFFSGDMPDPSELIGNLFYATAMCRVHYRRVRDPLPTNEPHALAQYYKDFYNTRLGKATVEQALPHFECAFSGGL